MKIGNYQLKHYTRRSSLKIQYRNLIKKQRKSKVKLKSKTEENSKYYARIKREDEFRVKVSK